MSFWMLRLFPNIRPSHRPHNSATREYVWPIFLVQLLIQAPRVSLMMPVTLAQSRLPQADLSVFNLKKPPRGGRGPTYMMDGFCRWKVFRRENVEEASGCRGDLSKYGIGIKACWFPEQLVSGQPNAPNSHRKGHGPRNIACWVGVLVGDCCEILKYSQVYKPYRSIVGQERGWTHRDLNECRKIN